MTRQYDGGHAHRRSGSDQSAEIVGILDLVKHQDGPWPIRQRRTQIRECVRICQRRNALVDYGAGQPGKRRGVHRPHGNTRPLCHLRQLRPAGGVTGQKVDAAKRLGPHCESARHRVDPVDPRWSLAFRRAGTCVYNLSPLHYHPSTVKILDRYILRELFVPFAVGLSIFTSILLVVRILKLVEMVVNRGVPLGEVLKLFSYIMPAFLEVTVPMALLLAVLIAFGRLSSDSEIIALQAAGVSLYRMCRPVAAFAAAVAALTLGLSTYVRPWGNSLLRTALFEILSTRAVASLKPRIFNDQFGGLVIYVDRIEPATDELEGILVADTRDPGMRNTIYAERGRLVSGKGGHTLTLRLTSGGIYTTGTKENGFQDTRFSTYDITLDLDAAMAQMRPRTKDPSEMTLAELRETIAEKAARNEPSFVEQVEVQRKFSIPFGCFVLAAVGVPLGIQPSRSVHSRGFTISLVLIFIYYMLLTLGQNLGERGTLPPAVAVWLPNGVLSAIAIHLFSRAARDSGGPRATPWGTLAARLRKLFARRHVPTD